MVSNESSFSADMGQLGNALAEGAEDVGQFVGLVDADVLPGDPAKMHEVAGWLTTLAGAFDRAGQGFKAIDDGGWYGAAADSFHHYLDQAAPKWFSAADEFDSAGKAVTSYADTLAWAKPRAVQAKKDLEAAQARTEAAQERHNVQVDRYNAQVEQANAGNGPPPTPPGLFTDPAAEAHAAAQHTIEQAQAAVKDAGDRATRAVLHAMREAPAEPGWMTQLRENTVDGFQLMGRQLGNVAQGAGSALAGLVQQVRLVNPFDTYNVTHPATFADNLDQMGHGVLAAVQNPYQAAKTVVAVDGWQNKPLHTLGTMGPAAIASLAGGGGVLARLGSSAGRLARRGDAIADPAKPGPKPTTPPAAPAPHGPQPSSPESEPPWGDSELPQRQQGPIGTAGPRPDGGFGPMGSPAPETPTPQHSADPIDRVDRIHPWERGTDDIPDSPLDNNAANSDRIAPAPDPVPQQAPGPEFSPDSPTAHPDGGTDSQSVPGQSPDPVGADSSGNSDFRATEQDHQAYRERLEHRLEGSFEDNLAKLRGDYPELAHLPDEEAMGIRRYVGEDANMINRALRQGDEIDQQYLDPEIKNIRSGLNQLPDISTQDSPVAYRDIGVAADDLPAVLSRYEPGQVVEEPAFTSASKEDPPAYFAGPGQEKVQFVIEPRYAKDLEFINPEEREIVWPDGNHFEVVRRDYVDSPGQGEWRIYLRDHGR